MSKEEEGFPITALWEIKILWKLSHPNIVNLYDIVVSKRKISFILAVDPRVQRPEVYIVFPYMEHDMHGLLDKNVNFSMSHIKCLMRQLLEGIKYLHQNSVMHWDIKGANLLLNKKGNLKLTDFGLAWKYDPIEHQRLNLTNWVVTLWYWAPELLLGSVNYDTKIDIWSAGCFFIELLINKPVFPGNNEL